MSSKLNRLKHPCLKGRGTSIWLDSTFRLGAGCGISLLSGKTGRRWRQPISAAPRRVRTRTRKASAAAATPSWQRRAPHFPSSQVLSLGSMLALVEANVGPPVKPEGGGGWGGFWSKTAANTAAAAMFTQASPASHRLRAGSHLLLHPHSCACHGNPMRQSPWAQRLLSRPYGVIHRVDTRWLDTCDEHRNEVGECVAFRPRPAPAAR